MELPARGHAQQARTGARHWQHRDLETGPGHALERNADRAVGGRADRLPRRRAPGRDVVGSSCRRGADAVAQGRPDLVHRIDGRGQADHGEGRRHAQTSLSRARRQVGHHRPRRRRLRHVGAIGHRGVFPRRAGLCHPDAHAPAPLALCGGRRDPQGHLGSGGVRRPATTRRPHGPRHLVKTTRPRAGLHREGRSRGRHARARWRQAQPTRRRAGSSSRRSSPTSTTP